jgi:hypothetical protein
MQSEETETTMESPHHSLVAISDPSRLREEIAYMEARLAEIGDDGDCAYENAMIRFFEQQLAQRRSRIAATAPLLPGCATVRVGAPSGAIPS